MTTKADIVKGSKDRQEKAEKMYSVALVGIQASRKGILHFAAAMQNIRDNELYLELDYDTFAALCCSPEIALQPATVEKYIKIYDYWVVDQEVSMDNLTGIGINKLEYIQGLKNPSKYLEEAKTLAYKDFKKLIDEKEFGVEPEEDKPKAEQLDCPHWIKCKCTKGDK